MRGSDRARKLRVDQTDAEATPWRHVRARQLGGCKFRRQCPISGYIVDFLCLERRVVVEVDGGRHALPENDRRRTHDLESMGLIAIRFFNDDVLARTEAVLEEIQATLLAPHPDPLPAHGERERIAAHRAHRRGSARP
jgi:primosomal protein N' (replication factor Y)